jgi:tetratricopeptide (TPR) repeat protein
LINSVLVFKLSRYFLKRNDLSLLVSLLFVFHPMHVENVVWLSARKDLVYGFFFLLGIWQYLKYLEKKHWYNYASLLLFFILSLFSKSNAVVFPAILVLVDIYENRDFKLKYLLNKLHLFALSGIFIYITVSTQESAGFLRSFGGQYNFLDRILMGIYSLVYYIFQLVIPFDLSPKNLYPTKIEGFLPWTYYLAPLALAGIAFLVYKFRKKGKLLWFGFAFFLIIIAPVLKLIPTGNDIVSNRYVYLPYIGLYIILAKWLFTKAPKAVRWLTVLWIVGLGVYSFNYQQHYENSQVLWTKVIADNQANPWGKAMALNERGQVKMKAGQDQAAFRDINEALNLEPNLARGLMNKAVLLDEKGESEAALEALNKLLKSSPNLVDALKLRGMVYGKLNRSEQAMEDFSKAISISPENAELFNNRGIAYSIKGKTQGALKDFNKAIQLAPTAVKFRLNRANLYQQMQAYDKAASDYKWVMNKGNKSLTVIYPLAKLYYKTQRDDKADSLLQTFKTDPQIASEIGARLLSDSLPKQSLEFLNIAMEAPSLRDKSLYQRSQVYKQLGEPQNAIDDLLAVLENVPRGQIFFELAELYFQVDKLNKACEFWHEGAIRSHPPSVAREKEFCNK